MALSKDTILPAEEGIIGEFPVLANAEIFEGSVVSLTSAGYAKAYAGTDTLFAGICVRYVKGTASSGGATVRVRRDVHHRQVTLSSAAVTDVGAALYASDDATYTKTSSSNLLVGKVHRLVTTDTIIARIEPAF